MWYFSPSHESHRGSLMTIGPSGYCEQTLWQKKALQTRFSTSVQLLLRLINLLLHVPFRFDVLDLIWNRRSAEQEISEVISRHLRMELLRAYLRLSVLDLQAPKVADQYGKVIYISSEHPLILGGRFHQQLNECHVGTDQAHRKLDIHDCSIIHVERRPQK